MTSTHYPGWEIVQEIGSGSFGTVYEIQKTQSYGFTENSALKVIRIPASVSEIKEYENEGYDEQSITAMFKDQMEEITAEFGLMSKLKGTSNIVSYEDHSVIPHEDGIGWDIYIRMELLTSLPDYIKERKTVDEETVLRIGRDICKALMLCEKHGIIHRDIKPSNIFLNRNDDFKLGDFGIAKMSDHTTRGAKTGTYAYMAPEVFNNKPYGFRADIYSLGMVLYWLLNERRGPFLPLPPEGLRANMHSEALTRRMDGEALPAPAHGSEALKAIVLKACAFDPHERYRNASEMLKALNGIPANCEQETIPNLVVGDVPVPVSEQEEVVIVDETVGPFSEVTLVVTEDSVVEGTVGPFDVITNEILNEGTIGPFDDIPPDNLNGETDEFTPTPIPEPEPKPQKTKGAVFAAVTVVLALVIGVCAMFSDGNDSDTSTTVEETAYVETTYDEKGRIVNFPVTDDAGNVIGYGQNIYEDTCHETHEWYFSGLKKTEIFRELDDSGEVYLETYNYYSEQGVQIGKDVFAYPNAVGLKYITPDSYTIYEFDTLGRVTREIMTENYSGKQSPVWDWIRVPETGNVKQFKKIEDGEIVEWFESEYDPTGTYVTKDTYYYEDGTIRLIQEFTDVEVSGNSIAYKDAITTYYDRDGNVTEIQ